MNKDNEIVKESIDNLLEKDYSSNLNIIKEQIEGNRENIGIHKIYLQEMREEFFKIIGKMKEDIFSDKKILIDLIEIEYKQNNLNINIYNKINNLIDNLQ